MPAVGRRWVTVWQDDPSQVNALYYTADAVIEDVPSGTRTTGRDAIRQAVQADYTSFPGHTYGVRSAFAVGVRAAAGIVFRGTYTGTYPGLPPGSGQAVELRGALIFDLANGKVVREAEYYDSATLAAQVSQAPAGTPEATPGGERHRSCGRTAPDGQIARGG